VERIPRTATAVITVLTALAWVIAVLFFPPEQPALALGFIPAHLSGSVPPWPTAPVFLTPLTATLVHSGPIHLGFNLLIFVWCGTQVERVLGKTGLITLYLVGAYASALAQWGTAQASVIPMVGASGAISAVIGAYALSFGRAKRVTNNFHLNRWINVVWLMVAWVVLQAMMGWLANNEGYALAIAAHIGGFAAGLLLQRPLLLWRYRKA
jgi:membrane associated rhomboid family serine protease